MTDTQDKAEMQAEEAMGPRPELSEVMPPNLVLKLLVVGMGVLLVVVVITFFILLAMGVHKKDDIAENDLATVEQLTEQQVEPLGSLAQLQKNISLNAHEMIEGITIDQGVVVVQIKNSSTQSSRIEIIQQNDAVDIDIQRPE